jgi:hypothetical protein
MKTKQNVKKGRGTKNYAGKERDSSAVIMNKD